MPAFTPAGIAVGALFVSDLRTSADFYGALFGLDYLREFSVDGQVTGCALGRADLDFALAFRLRGSDGHPYPPGEHPLEWSVRDRAALEAFRERAGALGLQPNSGEHDDAAWVEVLDPDGIGVRVVLPLRRWTEFHGYEWQDGAYRSVPAPLLSPSTSSGGPLA